MDLFLLHVLGSIFVLPRSGEWIFPNRNLLGQEHFLKSSKAYLLFFFPERERIHFPRLLFRKISTASVAKGSMEQPVSPSNGISLLLCFANEKCTDGQDFLLAAGGAALAMSRMVSGKSHSRFGQDVKNESRPSAEMEGRMITTEKQSMCHCDRHSVPFSVKC